MTKIYVDLRKTSKKTTYKLRLYCLRQHYDRTKDSTNNVKCLTQT